MKTKVLVTGANGQLGQTIKKLGASIDFIEFTFVSKRELDITDKVQVNSFFTQNKFDYCINCAAYTNVEQAEKSPEIALKVNTEGVKNIAQGCLLSNCILIHISTDYVFDGEKNEPYTISDTPNPINAYGRSKLFGEQNIQEVLDKYFIIRTSWLYSKEFGHNFYRTIVDKVKTEKTLTITNEQIGCPTNTIDLSDYIIELIKQKPTSYGVKHFCGTIIMTWYDFAQSILEELNVSNQIKLVKATKYLTFARRPKNSALFNSNRFWDYTI